MGLIIHIDGGSRGNPGPAGAGVVIHREDGALIHESAHFLGEQTNNAAEYLALILALRRATRCESKAIRVNSDSQLLVRQITGEYQVKNPKLLEFYEQAQLLLIKIQRWTMRHIPREHNSCADKLANMAMDRGESVLVFDIEQDAGASIEPEPEPDAPVPKGAGTSDSASPNTKTPADRGVANDEPRAVQVRVAETPNPSTCPARNSPSATIRITHTLPAGLCVHAAQALLPTVIAILNTDSSEYSAVPTMTVRCSHPECAASFHVSPARPGNGSPRRVGD